MHGKKTSLAKTFYERSYSELNFAGITIIEFNINNGLVVNQYGVYAI